MNTANLQLEGLYLAFAAINAVLVRRGILTAEDIRDALDEASAVAGRDSHDVSSANRDAVTFPIRFLRRAMEQANTASLSTFSELARQVGEAPSAVMDAKGRKPSGD
jgi:hypothetical protein